MKKKCKIRGCSKIHWGRGWCRKHYESEYYSKNPHYRRKLTSQDILAIRHGYIQGLTAVEVGQKIGVQYLTICEYFAKVRLTKKELAKIYINLRDLHRRYDKLRSFKSLKERAIEAHATIFCRRMDRQEGRKRISV